MSDSALWPCASPSPARSGPWRPSRIPRGPPSKTIGNPCVFGVPPLEFCWRPMCPGWRNDPHGRNMTLIEKPFKKLVKMNNSAMWPSASPSPARSGRWRPSRIPRGPPSKTIGIPCVSEVPPLEFHWRPRSPGCGPYPYRQNLTLIEKPL